MELVLVVCTILGGITAVWFLVEKIYKPKRKAKEALTSDVQSSQHKTTSSTIDPKVYGASQSGRHPFFINEPSYSIKEGLTKAKTEDKLLFIVIYNERHPSKSKLFYSLGCFMDYFTTKQLVEDHFVTALVPSTDPDSKELIPENDPLENCRWIVLDSDKQVIKSEGVYANSDEGLKRVRSVIAINQKAQLIGGHNSGGCAPSIVTP